jgi:hypothetical protein
MPGVWNTLPSFGRHQLVVRDDVRYANHVPKQRESQPPTGTSERAYIEIRQVQCVRLGRAVIVGDIGQRDASDREPSGREQS